MADTHTIMPKKLAEALMEAGMKHFDSGGLIGGLSNALGTTNNFQPDTVDNKSMINQQYGQQQDVYGQQQALASQLLAQTQGGGPGNALVAQQGANLGAQQAATMANVRGASANPGLVARNAAIAGQQGQQQTLNAQEQLQLQSQGALAQQQSTMANQSLQGQSIGQGALASANNVGAGIAGQNAQTNAGIFGGLLGGAAGALGLAEGGEVPQKMAIGGVAQPMGIQNYGAGGIPNFGMTAGGSGMGGGMGNGLSSFLSTGAKSMGSPSSSVPATGPGSAEDAASGGLLTMGAQQQENQMSGLPLYPASGFACGGQVSFNQMLAGGNVPGKAEVKGDSKKNDKVPTLLSPGEDVIPRSITQLPEPEMEKKALEFLRHLKSKQKGYDGVVSARKAK